MIEVSELAKATAHFSDDLPMVMTEPSVDTDSIAESWVEQQGKYWPAELTAAVLTGTKQTVYTPAVVIAERFVASAPWAAVVSIAHTRHVPCPRRPHTSGETCSRCWDRGFVEETYYEKKSESGYVNTELNAGWYRVEASGGGVRKCGEASMSTAVGSVDLAVNTKDFRAALTMPSTVRSAEGLKTFVTQKVLDTVQSDARSIAGKIGSVEDIQLGEVNVDPLPPGNSFLHLYPIILSEYEYRGQTRQVQIDGVSGKMWVQLPRSVKAGRVLRWSAAAAAVVAAITLFSQYC